MKKKKIIRACTVPQSLGFVVGMIPELVKEYEVTVVTSPGKEWEIINPYRESVKRIEVPMERHISPVRDLKALVKLIKVLRRERPDMVHSMTPKAGLLCMIAAKFTGVPVRIHTFTGLVFPITTGLKRKILMATDWLTCACATHVIPEGEGVKRDLLNNGITKKDIKVLGYGNVKGIDLEWFDKPPEVMKEAEKLRTPNKFAFIAIGRLVGDKGIHELVDAFRRLNKENPNTHLLLVGPFEPELDPINPELLKEISDNPAIEAVGRQRDVRPWLAASDCAVLASYREGFPNVVIEAGAMGLPQIVTDINGANEIIVEGRNGTIVPSKNPEALYHAMKRMIEDEEWRNMLSANARPMIASRYEQSFVRKCLYDFYDEILS